MLNCLRYKENDGEKQNLRIMMTNVQKRKSCGDIHALLFCIIFLQFFKKLLKFSIYMALKSCIFTTPFQKYRAQNC